MVMLMVMAKRLYLFGYISLSLHEVASGSYWTLWNIVPFAMFGNCSLGLDYGDGVSLNGMGIGDGFQQRCGCAMALVMVMTDGEMNEKKIKMIVRENSINCLELASFATLKGYRVVMGSEKGNGNLMEMAWPHGGQGIRMEIGERDGCGDGDQDSGLRRYRREMGMGMGMVSWWRLSTDDGLVYGEHVASWRW